MAWLSGWSYRKEITITGQSGAGTDFQVKFDIGDSAGGDFHLEGHCTNFPQDIEVTDNDGTTLLKFWIKDITADPLRMWIKVADDLGSNQTIYIYYGKSGATTNSDGPATFISHFDGDSTGWTEVDPNSRIAFANNRLEFSGILRNENAYVYQAYAETADVIIESTFRATSGNTGGLFTSSALGDTVDDSYNINNAFLGNFCAYDSNKRVTIRKADTPTYGGGSAIADATTYYTRTTLVGDVLTIDYFTDAARTNSAHQSSAEVADLPTMNYVYLFQSYNSAQSQYNISGWIDNFWVRNYNSPEPAFSSAGAEQTPPTGASPTSVFYGPLVGPLGGPI